MYVVQERKKNILKVNFVLGCVWGKHLNRILTRSSNKNNNNIVNKVGLFQESTA